VGPPKFDFDMTNIFAMVTLKSSNFYTKHALASFFKNTEMESDDEFLLINNDYADKEKFSTYSKVKIIENKKPLGFAENVNQAIDEAIKKKKNLIFLNNDIIFTKNWFNAMNSNLKNISIPVNNQIFTYKSDCGNLNLTPTMTLGEFNENYDLLDNIVLQHKERFKPNLKFQTPLMPFFCFKVPYEVLRDVGYLDTSFGKGGGEDIDYRIRCAVKNHEVNFLIDSYLLHFHGKSTWDGGEKKEQIEKRNELYTKVFEKKWGKEMTQLFIIRKDFQNILSEKGLEELFKNGRFGDLIRKII